MNAPSIRKKIWREAAEFRANENDVALHVGLVKHAGKDRWAKEES